MLICERFADSRVKPIRRPNILFSYIIGLNRSTQLLSPTAAKVEE